MLLEEKLYDYLSGALTVPVYAELPANRPDRYVVFEKTAMSETEHIRTATVAIRSVGQTMLDSIQIDHEVIDAMDNFTDVKNISKVQLNADANWTNTSTKEYRQQAVFLITFMED